MCVKELTEEGIPFLILFHQKDDTNSMEKFQQEVARQLIGEKGMHRDQRAMSGSIFNLLSLWLWSHLLQVFSYWLTLSTLLFKTLGAYALEEPLRSS